MRCPQIANSGRTSTARAEDAAARSDTFSRAHTRDDDDFSGRRYSYDRAWDRRDDLDAHGERLYPFSVDDIRAQRRRKRNMWLAVFGLWVLFTFGNSMLRGLTAELEGTIESSQYASQQLSHNLFYGDTLSGLGHRLAYTIRKAGGRRVTFMPGAACSLLYGHPRIGAHIYKEPWRASYELDGRLVSDLRLAGLQASAGRGSRRRPWRRRPLRRRAC